MNERRDLPPGWTLAPLRDLATINPTNPASVPADDTPVSFVPMASVEELSGRMNASTTRVWSDVKKGFTRFQDGDVVFAKITPSMENGKVALAANLFNGVAAGTTEFHVFRPQSGVTGRYLLHYLLQETFRRRARARMTGTAGQLRVPTQFLEEEVIPLAPTPEQQRIVEAIDSYLTRVDDAVVSLERVQAKLKAYRASVLKAAVEGRLVPIEAALAQAEKRDYEPAGVLLARILKERRRRWEQAELAKLKTGGRTPKDDKWKAKYEEPVAPDTNMLPALPDGWCWAILPQLGELNRGKSKHRPRNDPRLLGGKYPFVQTGDIRRADTWLRTFEDTYSDFGLAQSRLWPAGTLCITIAANIAETAILGFEACFPDSVVGFLQSEPVLTRYVEMFFRTARQRLEQYAPATAQKNINLDTLTKVAIPLPPLNEQRRMAEEFDRLLSVEAAIRDYVLADQHRCSRLRQAVLKWAFEGRLVDQDPADEPAEGLLARIRAERAALTPTKKSRGRRAKGAA